MLEIRDVHKDFRGVHALKGANACFYEGEIHGLVGENGAGKSTMMKIVCGLYPADGGQIIIDGKEVKFQRPSDAYKAGIRIVHQELSLVRSLTVAENIFIHKYIKGALFSVVNRNELVKKAEKMLAEWGINIEADKKVINYSMGIRQLVEIARELSSGGKVIILDEPTSSLTASEIVKLFEIVRRLKEQGLIIIFISHRLDEVTELVDRLTVLRDGETIGTALTKDMTPTEICRMIADTDVENLYPKSDAKIADLSLEVKGFTGAGFNDISIRVNSGEIVGLVGLIGAGRSELCRAIVGADKYKQGALYINNKQVKIRSVRDALKNNMVLLSENREEDGIFPEMSVAKNMIMLSIKNVVNKLAIKKHLLKGVADDMGKKLNVVSYNSMKQMVSELSGGNQQKVLFGRLLVPKPKILLLDEPTRGVDIHNKTEIHKIIGSFVQEGGSVLMVSSELDEVFGICDRIYVLHEGTMVVELSREEFERETVLKYMMGLEQGRTVE